MWRCRGLGIALLAFSYICVSFDLLCLFYWRHVWFQGWKICI